jgi:hypothetical protein
VSEVTANATEMPPADVLRAANVNACTGLATDYLNVFNEALMLLELTPDAPDMLEDLIHWRAPGYADHFERSAFQGRAIVISAWRALPASRRTAFEAEARDLERGIQDGVAQLLDLIARNEDFAATAERACARARAGIARLDAMVHGRDSEPENAQDAIDALFS